MLMVCELAYRLEFDAYRTDMEQQNLTPRDSSASIAKTEEMKRKFDDQKEKYDKLRADVAIKLKFLDENRVSVDRNMIYGQMW